MSSSPYTEVNEQYDDEDIVTLYDETGRSLDCYIENSLELDDSTYYLLLPVDTPVVILVEDDEDEEEEVGETLMIEESSQLGEIFLDAKAVLAELELSLKNTAYTLTVSGELPPLEDDNIISLELDEDDDKIEAEELQFLASFYHLEQKYNICTPLAPILFVAHSDRYGKLEMLSPEDEELHSILEELLFDELD